MSPRWRKVAADLGENRARTLLVWLAIAVGTAAVATAMGGRAILSREIDASFDGTNPAAIVVTLDGAVDAGLVERVRSLPGIRDAEARGAVRARAEIAPGEWRPFYVTAVRDFSDVRISTFLPAGGAWPPADGELLIERSCTSVLGVTTGGSVHVRAPGGATADLRVSGLVHDPGEAPGWQDHVGYAYATPATLERLGRTASLDELLVTVDDPGREAVARVAAELGRWLGDDGRVVRRIQTPGLHHPHVDHMNAMMALLSSFSLFALALAGAIAASVMAATLARHARQIGVMKAVGATSGQIAGMYFAFVAVLAGSAGLAGVALGVAGARAFAVEIAGQLNLAVASLAVPTSTLAVEALLGLGVPLLAAAVPVVRAARRPANEAIRDPGVRAPSRAGVLSRAVSRIAPDRTFALALRNTFRRPARLSLTLGALGLGGTMLMAAVNVYFGLLGAVDNTIAARGADVEVRLTRSASAGDLAAIANAIPGVREAAAGGLAAVAVDTSSSGSRYALVTRPAGATFLQLPAVEGRWPEPDETGAVVVSRAVLTREPAVGLGAEVGLVVEGRRTPVHVVGIVEEVAPSAFYTNAPTFEAVTATSGRAGVLFVRAEPGAEARVASALEDALVDAGHFPSLLMTRGQLREAITDHLLIMLAVLAGAALTSVVVGGLGFATNMGLNVLERAREIGIARAIGATPRAVLRMLFVEAAAILSLSYALSVVLSLPATAAVTRIVAAHGLYVTVPLVVSPWALGAWAVLAATITAVACVAPALASLRLSVRDVVAYE